MRALFRMALLLIAALYAAFLAASLAPAPVTTVKIGVLGPLTGPGAGYGLSQKEGVELAASVMRAGRAPHAVRFELVFRDDEGKMELVGPLAVDLVLRERVSAIIGSIDSGSTHVLQMITAKFHVPMITTTSTDPSITKAGSYWTFRCLASDEHQARALAEHIFRQRGLSRVALVMQDNRYGRMGARELRRIAERYGRPLVLLKSFAKDQRDFSALARSVKASGADALVLWGLYRGTAAMVRAMAAEAPEIPLFGSDGLVHPAFLELAGPAAEGVVVTFPFNPHGGSLETREFTRAFARAYGREPDSFAAHSFDALNILAAAIQRCGSVQPEAIKDALLLTRDFRGATGRISIDARGDDPRPVTLAVVRLGVFAPLESLSGSSRTAP